MNQAPVAALDFAHTLGGRVEIATPDNGRKAVYYPEQKLLVLCPSLGPPARDRLIERMIAQL